jgi:hypothetical protein
MARNPVRGGIMDDGALGRHRIPKVSPRKPMLMPPDGLAEFTGERLEAHYLISRMDHNRALGSPLGLQDVSQPWVIANARLNVPARSLGPSC